MEIIGAALLGLAAGFINALSSGGGLIAIPGLIFMGASPASAVATSRMGVVGGSLTSAIRYQRGKAISWRYMPLFLVLAIIAGIAGPRLLILMPQHIISTSIALLMLLLLPLLFIQHDFGIKDVPRSRVRKAVGMLLMFVVLMYSTMFGAGSGILYIYVLVYMFGLTVIEANATTTVVALVGSAVALITYIHGGLVDFGLALPLTAGALAGGYLGARLALHEGSAWVKWILAAIMVAASIKLLAG